jgi:dihydroflavonol-4-reductase
MNRAAKDQTVLVTGITGFIGLHCAAQLIEAGYRVRGTLRDKSREAEVRSTLGTHDDLEIVEADLLRDTGWQDAAQGSTYVLHVASPLALEDPGNEDELIIPARDGTLRVLKAAADAGVGRVVVTSSMAAVSADGMPYRPDKIYDESDWSNPEAGISAYEKSKTLAERAAWAFVEQLPPDNPLTLACINPCLVLGPVLGSDDAVSIGVVSRLMRRDVPALPDIGFTVVDVRDVAAAHITAMTQANAAGHRFCCVGEAAGLIDIAKILHANYADRGYRIPTMRLPDWLVHVAAPFSGMAKQAARRLGATRRISNARIRSVLDWQPRPLEDTLVATAESLIEHGIV